MMQDARKQCERSLTNNSATKVEALSNKASLYHSGDDTEGVYFSAIGHSIGYYARYKKVQIHHSLVPDENGIRQVLINSYPNMGPAKTGVGKKIFWDHLFPRFHTLISDSQQTENGRSFWEYRIAEALTNNLIVRMIDTNERTAVDIESVDTLHTLSPVIWGTQNWFQRVILIIMNGQEHEQTS